MDIKTYLQSLQAAPIIRLAGIVVGALFVAAFALALLSAVGVRPPSITSVSSIAPHGMPAYDSYDGDYAVAEESYGYGGGGVSLSARNVAAIYPPQPYPGGSVGDDAEMYEAMQYSVTVRSGNAERDCATIRDLKSRNEVVFESMNEHERGCSATFKVAKASVDEIVAVLQALDPEDMSESVYTIVSQIKDYTSEEEILRGKLETVTSTLASATEAYDDITALAIRTQDADALARVIESKLQIIERLTQERISISAQLDRLTRAKAEQLDRLDYTYFNVTVYEDRIVNGESIAQLWRSAAAAMVNDVNRILTEATLGLIALLFLIAQWLLYAVMILVIGKITWRYARNYWSS